METEIIFTVILIAITAAIAIFLKTRKSTNKPPENIVNNQLPQESQNNTDNILTNSCSEMPTPNNKKNKRSKKKKVSTTPSAEVDENTIVPEIVNEENEIKPEVVNSDTPCEDKENSKERLTDYENKLKCALAEINLLTEINEKMDKQLKQNGDKTKTIEDFQQKLVDKDKLVLTLVQEQKVINDQLKLKTAEVNEVKQLMEIKVRDVKSKYDKELSQLQDDKVKLEGAFKDSDGKLKKLTIELDQQSQQKIDSLSEELTNKKLELTQLELSHQNLASKMSENQINLEKTQRQIAQLKNEQNDVEKSFMEAKRVMRVANEKSEQLKLCNDKLTQENEKVKKQLDKLKRESIDMRNNELDKYKKHSDIMGDELIKIQGRAYVAEQKVKELTEQLEKKSTLTNNKKLCELEQELVISKTECNELLQNYSSLNKNFNTLVQEKATIEAQYRSANAKIQTLSKESGIIEKLKKDNEELKKCASKSKQKESGDDKAKDKTVVNLENHIAVLEGQVEHYHRTLESTEENLRNIQESVDNEEMNWKQNLLNSELTNQQLEDKIKQNQKELKELKEENEILQAKLSVAEKSSTNPNCCNEITITHNDATAHDNSDVVTMQFVAVESSNKKVDDDDNNNREEGENNETTGDNSNKKRRKRNNKKKNKKARDRHLKM